MAKLLIWLKRLWHSVYKPDKVMYIGGSDTLPPPLPRDEESVLLEKLNTGDFQVRQTLIEHNLRLVVYIARRFENTGIHIEDLISIGTIGLIKAVNTFRTDKNIKLATYASRCIENEILMYLRKNGAQRTEVSFDEPLNTDWDGKELLLSDVLGTDSDVVMRPIEADVDRQLLQTAVSHLSPRERYHHHAVWPGRYQGAHPKGGGGSIGDFAELHITAGEAYHPATAARIAENELKAVKEYTFTAFARSNIIVRIGRPDG